MKPYRALTALNLVIGLLWIRQPVQAQSNPAQDFYNQLNQIRLDEGLSPLGWSPLLTQAAQRHADDMASHQVIQSEGTDGSTYRQRVRDAGYRAWNEGLTVFETLWAGLGGADNALNWYRTHADDWEPFTAARYREVGIGYATDAQGVHYFVITFGARPAVLPIFINDGNATTDSPQVAVRLTNEESEPLGEGNWIGKAIEVRLGNTPEFDGEPWQPWSPLLPWMLDGTEPGEYAVYVEFRDGAGRTAKSQDTIRLVSNGESPPEPIAPGTAEPLPQPTATPSPSPTEAPTTPPATETVVTPEVTLAPPPTSAPPTATELASPAPATATPQPTWTPLPLGYTVEIPPVDWPLILVFLLQGCVILLGLALFIKRR